jgi:hypothetical protein
MEIHDLPVVAGAASTMIFMASSLPMLLKAFKTRDLNSYSHGSLLLTVLGNLIHWLYVSSLPIGPIWVLHGFFTLSTLAMLVFYNRYAGVPTDGRSLCGCPDA